MIRTEEDIIGKKEMPADALYGIHALRARENFPDRTPFPLEWYRAAGMVKKACYLTYRSYKNAVQEKNAEKILPGPLFPDDVITVLIDTAEEVAEGVHFEHFIVPAISGGAGTSINMNVNEIIANASLVKLGKKPGDYSVIDPITHANVFQSTNDVIPTSLKVALMGLLGSLETAVNELRFLVEQLENAHRHDLRIGYTQMQEAVPTSFGILFSTYSEALSRDWWRVSKCSERIKPVNLGGSAIGTGITVPRFYIMEVVANLQKLTGLPLARSENMPDATANLDSLVEVHAILKAHAVNLEKMVSDLRLLSSDIANPVLTPLPGWGGVGGGAGIRHLSIPARQAGSSIMPGKINPVIPEFVISAVHRVYSNDQLIASLCGQGCLELNAYTPVIGHAMIESLKLLIAGCQTLKNNLFSGLVVHPEAGIDKLYRSPVIATALVPYIGYHKAGEVAERIKSKGITVFEAADELVVLTPGKMAEIMKPENLLKMGYSLNDLG